MSRKSSIVLAALLAPSPGLFAEKTWRPGEIELVNKPIGKGGLIEEIEEKVEEAIK